MLILRMSSECKPVVTALMNFNCCGPGMPTYYLKLSGLPHLFLNLALLDLYILPNEMSWCWSKVASSELGIPGDLRDGACGGQGLN